MELSSIKGSKAGGCFSRVGAASLFNLPREKFRAVSIKQQDNVEYPEQQAQATPIDRYLDRMLEGVNIEYERSKQRLKKLQAKTEPSKLTSRSNSHTNFRIRRDVEPTMPTVEFMQGVDKCTKFRKPTGCALSMFVLERAEDEPTNREKSNSRLYQIAEREFRKEIAHMRNGIESLKSINLKK